MPSFTVPLLVASVLCLATAVTAAPVGADPVAPVFPSVWSAREEVSATTTPQRIAQQVYFDGPNNRELALTNQSMYDTMITDWSQGIEGKVYYIRTYGNPRVRHCEFWCTPTTPIACDAGDSLCSNDYNQSAAFVETATVNGQATNLFKWHENLGPIPMNELYLYVTQTAPFAPVRMIRDVHPFGKEYGNVTIDFTDFRALKSIDPSLFDLGPDAKYACSDPEPSSQCPTDTPVRAALGKTSKKL